MKKSELKGSFSKGRKPKESDFHGLLESYIHKTDDEDLTIDENTKNVGIGIQSPAAKLHVDGGLIIGNVSDPEDDNGVQIFQGTLRWTGTRLEVFFGGAWKTVWQDSAGSNNLRTVSEPVNFPSNLRVKTPGGVGDLEKSSAVFNFPNNAVRISDIQFTLEYTRSYSTNPIPSSTPPTLVIGLRAVNGALIWETPQPIDLPNQSSARTIELPKYALNSNIETIGTFIFFFKINRGSSFGNPSLSVKPTKATITYIVNSAT